ncbi:MAG TPA: bifunctional YncE family protein/alkaline phosphatase family protein [Bryobacteraceae bacterium]|jgi:YVTN family beta-propeller protein|nr:bifunctional YncE family protein/alkaline phosphatase family protein [Bryobacteraceae bacterium]
MKPALRTPALRLSLAFAAVAIAAVLFSQSAPRERVGPLPDGGFLLNSGWKLAPAGKQIPLDTLPMSSALSLDGKYLFVLNAGYRPPSVTVMDAASGSVLSSQKLADGWLGLAVGPSRDRVYVGGGTTASVIELAFSDGVLKPSRTFPIVEHPNPKEDFIGDVAFSPDGRLIYAADLYHNSVVVINPQSGMVINRFKTGRRPYRILFAPDGKSFFVTHWADGTLGQYDANDGSVLATVRLGAHPTDIVWRNGGAPDADPDDAPAVAARLFVAAANTNNVYVIGVTPGRELKVIESINVAMSPRQPLGMTPSALAVAPDGKRLFVACSDANVAAVVDISSERSRVEGFIPTGWYPTAVRLLPNGTLVILNGKGLASYPNAANGPNPAQRPNGIHNEPGIRPGYVGYMQTGTASWIPPFTAAQLEAWTTQAIANSPYNDAKLDQTYTVPPIQHVVYIVKENRTYDQVLGDIKEGNSDPSLVLFGENVTPNLHKLAREFVLLDNFYVSADVSADGHNWSTAAIAPDYVQKMWPNEYAGRRKTYDFEEQDVASLPPAGYIWTAAASAGLTIRNYGYTVNNKPVAAAPGQEQITGVRDPVLAKYTNRLYRGFDLKYPDVERARTFLDDLAQWQKQGDMPRFIVMRLGNDHTSGTASGAVAPLSAAADNDLAVGRIVEGISHSRFWTSTLICILEDDAQNGPDHVDSHRSPAYLISPYIKRHSVDSAMYNTASMVRTMEIFLGLRPMTQFDAAARPMLAAFLSTPDPTPFTVEDPRQPLDAKNPSNAKGAEASNRMHFEDADENDDDQLNDVLWRSIRNDPPPAPVRSYFGK